MKQLLLFIFIMASLSVAAQNKYRFSVGGGFHSMMFWGFRSFEDIVIESGSDSYQIYKTETHDLDYRNFSSAINYSFGFSVNWINGENFMLSQRFSFFKGDLTDVINLTLVDIGDGTSTGYEFYDYNSSNVGIGSQANVIYKTEIGGGSTSLILYKRLKNKNLQLGGGVYYQGFSANDRWRNSEENALHEGYRPHAGSRARGYIGTNQIGLSLNLVWNWNFIQVYTNLGNTFITTKKEENKGYHEWPDGITIYPTSHNFDYRFPLTFETGIALSFDRIKK